MISALQAAIRLWLACTVLSLGFENQQRASLEVCEEFKKGQRYGLLRADLQSGKTGTYQLLIRKMFAEGLIDHVYILCGSHELELLNQVREDVESWHGGAPFKDRIHIVFRQNFKKTHMKLKRVLIVIDESHLVTGVHQTLCKFLKRHGLSMSGTNLRMVRDEIYMLSVDATPYLEESVMAYNEQKAKFRVFLESGAGYYGVANYLSDGHLRPTWDLRAEKQRFKELIAGCPQKYILVRAQSTNKQLRTLLDLASEAGCATLRFTSKEEKQGTQVVLTRAEADEHRRMYGRVIPCLEEAPARTTVVVIDGRLRCGKRVPKMHVGIVWELSKSNTDTLMQGLLGRMCGYEGGNSDVYNVPFVKPLIFVAGAALDKEKNKKKVVDCSELERAILSGVKSEINQQKVRIGPQKVAGLNPGHVQNKKFAGDAEVYPCAPIRFQLPAFQTESLADGSESYIKAMCMRYVQTHTRLIEENPLLTEDQREEIMSVVESWSYDERCANLRRYSGSSNDSMHKSHVKAFAWQCSATDGISNPERPTFCVTFPDFQPMEGVPMKAGEVFLIIYTRAKGLPHVLPLESRIARHDGTSHFCAPIEDHMAGVPAASFFGFSPEILRSAEAFEAQLDEFIGIGLVGHGLYGRRFTSLQSGEPIRLPRSVYGSHLEIMKPILSRLRTRHNVTITYKFKPPFAASQFIEWTSLEWAPKA